jgi:hypothetical protein
MIMERAKRTIEDAATWNAVVTALPLEIVRAGAFRAEDRDEGLIVTMSQESVAAVDAILEDLPRLRQRDLVAYAADKRWRVEVGGISVDGVPVATDDRSKVMVIGARVAAQASPDWTTVWHGADGQTYPLNAAAMIAISNAVEAHVNATFATFATVKAGIDAGEITTTAAIDAAFAAA